MNITKAFPSDASAILALQKQAYQSEAQLHNDFAIGPLTQSLEELIKDFDHKTILKIEHDQTLIASGQVVLSDSIAYIGRMAVHENFQGKGIGSKLMSALEDTFSAADFFEVFTGENSIRNLGMYERRGYIKFDEKVLGKTNVIFLRKDNR